MNPEEWLGGQLARAHMKRSRLRDEIDRLNRELHKAMHQLGRTDAQIWDLKGKIQLSSGRAAA